MKGRAVISAKGAGAYLEVPFGVHIPDARAAITTLARAYPHRTLAEAASELNENFRPWKHFATRRVVSFAIATHRLARLF